MTEQELNKHVRNCDEGFKKENKYHVSVDTRNGTSSAWFYHKDQACRVLATAYLSGVADHLQFHFFPDPNQEMVLFQMFNRRVEKSDKYVQAHFEEKKQFRDRQAHAKANV